MTKLTPYTDFKRESYSKSHYAQSLPEINSEEWFILALEMVWRTKMTNVLWLELEAFQRDVCKSSLTDSERLTLIRESIGAFTGRGVA